MTSSRGGQKKGGMTQLRKLDIITVTSALLGEIDQEKVHTRVSPCVIWTTKRERGGHNKYESIHRYRRNYVGKRERERRN